MLALRSVASASGRTLVCLCALRFRMWCVAAALLLLPASGSAARAAAGAPAPSTTTAACNLALEIIAAPFAVVDSNQPGVAGPRIATLAARLTNTGAATVHAPRVALGNGVGAGVFAQVGGAGLAMLPNVYLGDGQRRVRSPLGSYVTPAAQWQFVRIPLADLTAQGLDRTQVQTVELAWEYGAGSGTLWIDNLLVGAPGSVAAGQRVVYLRDKAHAPVALHVGAASAGQRAAPAGGCLRPALAPARIACSSRRSTG